jgi:transposase
MGRRYRGVQQPVPEQVRAWADPAVFELAELLGRLDVSGIEADYRADGVGGVPYDPRLMLLTVIWCYRQGIRGPDAIAKACREHVSLRAVWQRDQLPSAAAVRRFISRHPDGWQQISVSLLAVCDQAGLVDMSLTATDSTPVTTPAALSKTYTAARITVFIDEAEQDLARVRARLQALADEPGDITGFVEQGCGPLRHAEQWLLVRLDRLRRAEAHARDLTRQHQGDTLDRVRCWQDRVDKHTAELTAMTEWQNQKVAAYQSKVAAGHKPRGPAPHPAAQHPHIRRKQEALDRARARLTAAQDTRAGPRAQASTTDPGSRILKGKNTVRWVLGRLLTLTVTTGQLILAPVLSPAANDYAGLFPNLAATAATCRQAGITTPCGHHLADAGFAGTQTLTDPAPISGTLLISVTNEHDQTRGRTRRTHTEHRRQMAERLNTPEGQTLYRRRSPMIEPVFAHLLRTDRRLHTRGDAQHTEIIAIATAYNTSKYLKAHHHHHTTPPILDQH